jgi:phosphoglycolate phosphatase
VAGPGINSVTTPVGSSRKTGVSAIDLVIFDLDGTLVDSAPDIARAVAATLREVDVDPPSLDVVKTMVGDGARALIGRALTAAGAERDQDALFARFLVHYGRDLCVDTRVYDGVGEALGHLQSAGVAAAVITNKPGDLARRLLETLGLAPGLLTVIGDGDGFARKPDPAAAQDAMRRAGVSAAATAVIGDGLPDMRMARALGARAIAAAWGYVPVERLRAESPDVVAGDPTAAVAMVLAAR